VKADGGNNVTRILVVVCIALTGLLMAGPASAQVVELIRYSGTYPGSSIDGSDAVGVPSPTFSGFEPLSKIDIDQSAGILYVGDETHGRIYKFDLTGVSQPFAALSPNTILSPQFLGNTFNGELVVDNSGTATQGRIYAVNPNNSVTAYLPSGAPTNFPIDLVSENFCGGAVDSSGHLWLSHPGKGIYEYTATGEPTGLFFVPSGSHCPVDMDADGNFYVPETSSFRYVKKYSPTGALLTGMGLGIDVAVDRGDDHIYVLDTPGGSSYVNQLDSDGNLIKTFGLAEGSYPGLRNSKGIAVDQQTHNVYVTNNRNPPTVDVFAPTGPITVPNVTTKEARPTPTTALLRGTINPDSVSTMDCHFDWGVAPPGLEPGVYGTPIYNQIAPCAEGNSFSGSSDISVSAEITGLSKGVAYYFRLSVKSAGTEVIVNGEPQLFHAQGLPVVSDEFVDNVHTDGARVHATIKPEFGNTSFHVEYGPTTSYGSEFPIPDKPISTSSEPLTVITKTEHVVQDLSRLEPGTEYHYRVVASNQGGTTISSADHVFSTFPSRLPIDDPCPTTLARQQTGAALLSDCRAYELVSTAHAGGYDVESNLVPGQTPFDGYPRAQGPLRVLYGIHNGAIPGVPGNPTNRGVDPYVATRGSNGWGTSYVGIPADNPSANSPFSSTMADADAGLGIFAFGGPEICSPCFDDGTTGIPVHLPNGQLVQGMQGSIEPPAPATSDGLVEKHFSADGSHFVFSSTSKFEPAGNNSTGDVSIYDRNLDAGTTQVVSTDSSGNPLTCFQGAGICHAPGNGDGIAELDISADGSRILTGQKVSTDAQGNDYYHLYMHIGTSPNSADLTPGASTGALYNGMTADASSVFLTTKDHLLSTDTDASADIYEAAISGGGVVTPRLVTIESGSVVNDDRCTPPGEPSTWNAASGDGKCSAVAFAGGAGVAAEVPAIYFLSPELLDGSLGEAGEPNLYVAEPGSDPKFVATIDTSVGKPGPQPAQHPLEKSNFAGTLQEPGGLTVDQSNGDVYLAEVGTGKVRRFTATGSPHNFTAGPDAGTNTLTGFFWTGSDVAQVAVDNSPGPSNGNIYVVYGEEFFEKYVDVYSPSGELITTLTGAGTPFGGFLLASGVAVNQTNGDVYVSDLFGGIWRYSPSDGSVSEADYSGGIEGPFGLSGVTAVAGKVHVRNLGDETVKTYLSSDFALGPPPTPTPTPLATSATAVSSDPATGEVYVDQGDKIAVFDSSGAPLETFGIGDLTGSVGVAVRSSNRHVFAATGGTQVAEFGYVPASYSPIDHPAIVHAIEQSGTHDWSDFQVSPTGEFAAFTTALPLESAYDNGGFMEVYRYHSSSQELDCVSCVLTGALATSAGGLASNGLSLADDGRVFFDSGEQLVLRDANDRVDVYEWQKEGVGPSPGNCDFANPNILPSGICLSLISTGSSPFDSRLLSATADGADVFFFTHDTLSHDDENGPLTKIYDARTNGGVFHVPPPARCAASDECHGPGSEAASPPPIRTVAGSPGNTPSARCKRGKVRKNGKCTKKKRKQHRGRQGGGR
jgi:hypothetical protein